MVTWNQLGQPEIDDYWQQRKAARAVRRPASRLRRLTPTVDRVCAVAALIIACAVLFVCITGR